MTSRSKVQATIAMFAVAIALVVPNRTASATTAFEEAITRWHNLTTGGQAVNPANPGVRAALDTLDRDAHTHRTTMVTRPDRTFLWPDLADAHERTTQNTVGRLYTLALAYATKGAAARGDIALRDAVVAGLRWIHDNRYNPSKPVTGNWYQWEIGTPGLLIDTMMLVRDGIPEDLHGALVADVAHFIPDPTRSEARKVEETGANRTDKAYITLRRGLLAGDETVVRMGRDALNQVFQYVTKGDGFYRDGTFIQHTDIPYTTEYGITLLGQVGRSLAVLSGSPWAVSDPNVTNWIFDTFRFATFRGQALDNLRGRSIAKKTMTNHTLGWTLAVHLALMAEAAGAGERTRIAAMVAGALRANPLIQPRGIVGITLVDRLVQDVAPAGDLNIHKQFPASDRLMHYRPGYLFSVSARSSRIGAYEVGNKENLRGWYTGEGMTYLYNADLGQYSDNFWPTVDPYRLPGVTNATEATYPRSAFDDGTWATYNGPDDWAGGAVLNDKSGAYGMAFTAEADRKTKQPIDLTGRKSWFAIGDTIVALGSGIKASGVAAQTTVENRLLPNGGATVTVDGHAQSTKGWNASLSGARWAHLSGVGGYVFPAGGNLRGLGEARTGRWSAIGPSKPADADDEVTRDYATIWFDHGASPAAATYAYYLLPGKSAAETRRFAHTKPVTIEDNTATVQSIRVNDGAAQVLGANFWAAGSTMGLIKSSQPASVMMRQHPGGRLDIAISDPTQKQGVMTFELHRQGMSVESADPNVKVFSVGGTVKLQVDATGKAGAASRLSLRVARSG